MRLRNSSAKLAAVLSGLGGQMVVLILQAKIGPHSGDCFTDVVRTLKGDPT